MQNIDALWTEYARTRSVKTRNAIVEHFIEFAARLATNVHQKVPHAVQADDVQQYAMVGLIQAVEAYQLGRGTRFKTFAAYRIVGAIRDGLRDMDPVARLSRQAAKHYQAELERLTKELGREPHEHELPPRVTESAQPDIDGCCVVREVPSKNRRADCRSSMRDLVSVLLRGLSQQERLVILLYYFDHMTMRQIGEQMKLSESRVSQVHSETIARIRERLEGREKEFLIDERDIRERNHPRRVGHTWRLSVSP